MVDFTIDAALEPGAVPTLFERWAAVADQPDVTFVLPEQSLHPSALVLLGAIVAGRRHRGLPNSAAGVADASPLSFTLIQDPGVAHEVRSGQALKHLRPITSLQAAREMADRTADTMMEIAPSLSPSVVRMVRFVFEELGANVVQHSGAPETGFGFAKLDPARRRFELAFADAGVGFRTSLQRHPELEGRIADDAEALQLAVSPRITGTSAPRTNMGIGLKILMDFSDLLGGDVWIASGSALLHRKSTAGQRTNVVRSIPRWEGSWICLEAAVA